MSDRIQCFVMMPIRSGAEREYWLGVLNNIIEPAIKSGNHDIDVKRVDLIPGSGNWLKSIVEHTHSADVVVADLTNSNPNVMWELGLRHGTSSSCTIIIAQDLIDIPSDLRGYNAFVYKRDGSDVAELGKKIAGCIQRHLDSHGVVDSPFFDHISPDQSRRRDIIFELHIEDTPLSAIEGSDDTISEANPRPQTEYEFIAQRTTGYDSSGRFDTLGWNERDLANYERDLREVAPEWTKIDQKNHEIRRINAEAIKLLPVCINKGDVPLEDIEIEIRLIGDGAVYDELPRELEYPKLPSKPRRKPTGAYGDLLNRIEGIADMSSYARSLNSDFIRQPMFKGPLIEPSYNGCHLDDGLIWCRAKKIRQHTECRRWDGFYYDGRILNNNDHFEIEIRAKNIRGFLVRRIPIHSIKGLTDHRHK